MAMADEAQQKIDAYLNRIRERLRGLRAEERREILEELRSHLVEKAAAGGMTGVAVDAALESLGSPEELAREYEGKLPHPIVGLRYSNVYGPGERHKGKLASMIYQLALQMRAGKRPRIFKGGEQKFPDHVRVLFPAVPA